MAAEKPRDDYNREAAGLFNKGERAAAESGESRVMLSVLTRGAFMNGTRSNIAHAHFQAFSNLVQGCGTTLLGHSTLW